MTYCISDIHGCYERFMELLKIIRFTPSSDSLYVLGDAIDRGMQPMECLMYIIEKNKVYFIPGNHELMMLDFYDNKNDTWRLNDNDITKVWLSSLTKIDRDAILSYVRTRPFYKTIAINGKKYFLSHSGLTIGLPFKYQTPHDLVWRREDFYRKNALKHYICIFGHTPTSYIRGSTDNSVWLDSVHRDKICIDCGCVYGGLLAAIRLEDGAVFYC